MILLALLFLILGYSLCGSIVWCVVHHGARREAARLVATLPALTTIAIWDGPPDGIPGWD